MLHLINGKRQQLDIINILFFGSCSDCLGLYLRFNAHVVEDSATTNPCSIHWYSNALPSSRPTLRDAVCPLPQRSPF